MGALCLTGACWLVIAGAATAAGWRIQTAPVLPGLTSGQLAAVSCASPGDCMAVGGTVDRAGVSLTLAERFAGGRWSMQTTPDPAGTTSASLSGVSCSSPTRCVAVGSSTRPGGDHVVLVEGWTGGRWRLQESPNPPGVASASLAGVSCTASWSCTAVGSQRTGSGVDRSLAERWDGVRWVVQRMPGSATRGAQLAGVSCVSATVCLAVGQTTWPGHVATLTEVWRARRWAIVRSPNPTVSRIFPESLIRGVVCSSPSACSAVGTYIPPFKRNAQSSSRPLVEAWNGTRWTITPARTPAGGTDVTLDAVSCSSPDACVATGSYEGPQGVVVLAERLNHSRWVIQTALTPDPGNGQPGLSGVSCASRVTCIAVLEFSNNASINQTLGERWTGTAWARTPTPNPPTKTSASTLNDVSCASAGNCTAVGSYTNTAGNPVALIERWNGSAWSRQLPAIFTAATASSLSGVSCPSATACVAVGSYTTATGAQDGLTEAWNGSGWRIQSAGGPAMSGVWCGAATACMAVGGFASERWDGTSWTIQSTPTANATGGLSAISCTSSNACIAVGSIPPATLAEAWDGTAWTLQSTPNATPDYYFEGGDWLSDVSCTAVTACTAVGGWSDYHVAGVIAELWDGQSWTFENLEPRGAFTSAALDGVSCLSTSDCTAVGTNGNPLAESWDGTSWTTENLPAPTGAASAQLNRVSCPTATTCTAVGSYTPTNSTDISSNGLPTQLIEQSS